MRRLFFGICLIVLIGLGLHPRAQAQSMGWNLTFQAAADLDCEQSPEVLDDAAWRSDAVDSLALGRSRALWIRLTVAHEPEPAALVAHNQIASHWIDHSRPDGPVRTSVARSPDTAAPGLLAVLLPHGPDAPAPGQSIHLCLFDRLVSASAVELTAVSLMPVEEFRDIQWRRMAMLGVAMGIMLAMAGLSAAFFFGLKERVFSDYAIYVIGFAAYVLNSTDALGWLFPPAVRDTPLVYITVVGAMAMMVVFGIRFTQVYTGVGESWPRLSRLASRLGLVCLLAAALLAISALIGPAATTIRSLASTLFNLSVAMVILGILVPVVHQALRGHLEARIYLLGWTPPLIILLGYILNYLGATPNELRPTSLMLMQAAAFEAMILGFGIAERARYYQQTRSSALFAADHDPLTGALGREALLGELTVAVDRGDPASLLYLDVDHFKSINDRLGHASGDTVLRRLVQCCQQELRGIDTLGRIGGEEFVALLPGTDGEQALRVAERIRQAIAKDTQFPAPVTISIGVASLQAADRVESWLERADRALYAAKHGGRNRVEESA